MISENGVTIPWRAARGEGLLARWRRRLLQRAELGRLIETSPHLIDDLGLDRHDVLAEARKPFWRT